MNRRRGHASKYVQNDLSDFTVELYDARSLNGSNVDPTSFRHPYGSRANASRAFASRVASSFSFTAAVPM